MNKVILILIAAWLSCAQVYASDSAIQPESTKTNSIALIEVETSLTALEASSLIQAGLQEKGFQIRFIQPVEKGLKKYQKDPGYLRVILFDPQTSDLPAGETGDELHVFVPLRVAVIETPEGSKVSSMPYAAVANTLSGEAQQVMSRWGGDIVDVIEGLPE